MPKTEFQSLKLLHDVLNHPARCKDSGDYRAFDFGTELEVQHTGWGGKHSRLAVIYSYDKFTSAHICMRQYSHT